MGKISSLFLPFEIEKAKLSQIPSRNLERKLIMMKPLDQEQRI